MRQRPWPKLVRLYGLRMGVEQSYTQGKQTLGWAEYHVRADLAIRRHGHLLACAFSLCGWAGAYPAWPARALPAAATQPAYEDPGQGGASAESAGHAGGSPTTRYADAGRRSWPLALRRVRAWLEPGIMLGRYWRAWSAKPPPPALQQLLDWLWEGHAIYLYVR